jgi:UDP-apiose/xylose synthase
VPASSSSSPPAAERIAVLGAGGFIGSHLVPALLAGRPGCLIDAVDITFEKLGPTPPDRVVRHQTRIDRPGLLEELTERCELIVSLTALCNPALYNTDPVAVIEANYTDLAPLPRLCAARGRRLLHLSTCEVYGRRALDATDGRPSAVMNEEATALFLGPVQAERWSYACAKQLLERLIWAHGQHAGLDFTIIRPFNVIGARMDFLPEIDGEGVPRVLASFINALLRGQALPLVDGGQQRRSFMSVEDFVAGTLRVIDRGAACAGQILNLGNPDNDVSIAELAEAIQAAYLRVVPGSRAPGVRHVTAEELYGPGYDDSAERIPDIGKAERLLEWRPATRLAEMLPPIVEDYVARYGPRLTGAPRAAGAQ